MAQDNTDNTVPVIWEHSGVWGNCLAGQTWGNEFEVTSDGTLAGSTSDKQFALPVHFSGQTRVGVECVVAAKRGSVSNSTTISFQACKVTAPSAPVLHEFTSAVENTTVFVWEASATAGDDCASKDVGSARVLYRLELVDENGTVVASETNIEETSRELNVSSFGGDYTWNVIAFNKNTPSLSAVATGQVRVKIAPQSESVTSSTSSTDVGENEVSYEVVITVGGGVSADNVTKESIIEDLVELAGEGVRDKIVDVVVEVSNGNVTSVVVVFDSKDMAKAVVDTVDELPKDDKDCSAGVLCRAISTVIKTRHPEPSMAHHFAPLFTTVAATLVVVICVLQN